MRNTKQRNLILQIINSSYNHPTAYEIYEECKKEIKDISLGTIYRNISVLSETNQIKLIKTNDNINHYDKMDDHSHFICIKCGTIIDIFDKFLDNIEEIENNKVIDCVVSFKGICEQCKKEEN